MILGRNNIYGLLWDFDEFLWTLTGRRFSPACIIRIFWPEYSAWLFGKMMGLSGTKR